MSKSKIIVMILVAGLLVGDGFLVWKYYTARQALNALESSVAAKKWSSQKALDFLDIFIARVLKAEEEVNFETRLQLENKMRGIGDADLLTQWQAFTDSATEAETQKEVTELLGVLVKKIKAER